MWNGEESLRIKTCRPESNRLNKFSLSIRHSYHSKLFATILFISVYDIIFIGLRTEGKNLDDSKMLKIRKWKTTWMNRLFVFLLLSHCIGYYRPCCLQLLKHFEIYLTFCLLSCQFSNVTSLHVNMFYAVFEISALKTFTSGIKLMYHTPDHFQAELIQLIKFFLPVGPNFAWRFNSLFGNPRNFESQCCDSIFI